jgi:hypothetical protein
LDEILKNLSNLHNNVSRNTRKKLHLHGRLDSRGLNTGNAPPKNMEEAIFLIDNIKLVQIS